MQFFKLKILVCLAMYIGCGVAVSGENDNYFHNYDMLRLMKDSAEDIHNSKSLRLLSDEDKVALKKFENLFPISINPASVLDFLPENTSDKCVEDLKYVVENLWIPGGWAMKMLDSYGKPQSGILLGNMKWLGRYDECLGTYAPSKGKTGFGDFHGKYCTLQVPFKFGPMSFGISTALCLPDSCNLSGTVLSILQNYNLTGLFSALGEPLESSIHNGTLTCKATTRKLTSGASVVIFLLSVFFVMAAIGSSITAYEHCMKRNLSMDGNCVSLAHVDSADGENVPQGQADHGMPTRAEEKTLLPAYLEKCKPFFNCFCIFTNGEKILNTTSSEGQLPALHGIRFLSMTWVIMGHTFGAINVVDNTAEAIKYIDHWIYQLVLNGFFSVDSFFVLSGFLVGYLYFQQAKKTDGKIPWLYFYIHRYVRLTPVYMLVIAFYTTIAPFLGSGPLWPDSVVNEDCKESWWWNAIYINNFLSVHQKRCLAWSWYLANDMQFYIISPLFLITLYRWPKIGYSLMGVFFSMTIVSNFVLTYEYDLIAGVSNLLANAVNLQNILSRFEDFSQIIYYKPYTRIGSYLVGLLLAYHVYRRQSSDSKSLNWVTLTVGWMIATGIALTCQFGLYHQDLSTVAASFYNALARIGFSLGVGWVIFVCVIGQGGVINSILSWRAFIPLSRLTYCAYLLHPIVIEIYSNSLKTLINYSHINMIFLYLGFLVISYSVAMVTSLLLESPIIRLERFIRNKFAL